MRQLLLELHLFGELLQGDLDDISVGRGHDLPNPMPLAAPLLNASLT
jgi:hypothetical protein